MTVSQVASGSGVTQGSLCLATYNIHKGVRGVGPTSRLEIHNLREAVKTLNADLVFLQEVHGFHHGHAKRFHRTSATGWPELGQAHYLAPQDYAVAYRTNAVTREGEHGNALLSRWPLGDISHHDVSDHRFEQRGLLHVPVLWGDGLLHAIVVHLGLMHSSRVRQVARLARYIEHHVPSAERLVVAGDFNDWGEKLDAPMRAMGLVRAVSPGRSPPRTFPSKVPLFSLDRIYMRGFRCVAGLVPQGVAWTKMSDHLPLIVQLETV